MESTSRTFCYFVLLFLKIWGHVSTMLCPNGQFVLNAQCVDCHPSCEECNGQEPYECTECGIDEDGTERFLYRSRCKLHCPRGFYQERDTYTCESCPLNCDLCSNANVCQKCKINFKIQNGECYLIQCLQGQIQDPETGECVNCGTGCKTCNTDESEICLSCLQSYFLYNLRCHEHCPTKTYEDSSRKMCLACPLGCLKCLNGTHCSSCQSGFYLHDTECIHNCPDGTYQNSKNWHCERCHKSCQTCHGPSSQDCDLCPDGKQPSFGMCHFVTCSEGQYYNVADARCHACDHSCQSCFGPQARDCFSCHAGFYLDEENQCVPSCSLGFFGDPFSQNCEKCSETCESCAGSKEHCLKCNTKEQYLFLHEGSCLSDCPDGYFENAEGSCETCDGSCWTCDERKNKCLSCVAGLYLENGKCLPNCSLRYYPDEDGFCKRCPVHCTSCADERTCIECSYLYLLFNGSCKATCPDGYYEDFDAGRCVSCHFSCKTCAGPTEDDCEMCPPANSKLFQGRCLDACPHETFYNKEVGECQECHRTCAVCSGPQATDCIQCQDQLTLDQESNLCGVKGDGNCPPGTFLEDDSFTCSSCDPTCDSCNGPFPRDCLTCSVPFYLYRNTCVKQCPGGTYNTSEEADGINLGLCSDCHQVCTTCHGGSAKDCDICAAGYYKLLHLCILHCPPGYYKNSNRCEKCNPHCQLCAGPGVDSCLECPSGTVQVEGTIQCVSQCSERFFLHGNKCRKCHPSCRTCNDSSVQACKTCDRGSTLKGSICYPQCEEHRYLDDDGICKPCDLSCRHCSGPGPDHCITCKINTAWSPEELKCIHCCDSQTDQNDCCFCDLNSVICIKHLQIEDEEVVLKNVKLASNLPPTAQNYSSVAPVMVLLVLFVVIAIFSLRQAKAKKILCWKQNYERLNGSTHAMTYCDKNCSGSEEEDSMDECDVLYSTSNGTVYKKYSFKLRPEGKVLQELACINKV